MTSGNLKLVDFCFSWNFQPCRNDANWEFWHDFPGISICYKKHLDDLTIWGWSPLSHAKKTSTSWNSWTFFTISVCIERSDTEMFRVLCAIRTSRYCNFLDLFLEFSCLTKNDLKHRNKPSQAVLFPADWYWGISPAQSTRFAALSFVAAVLEFGHKRPAYINRQLAQMTRQRRKSFGYPSLTLSAEGAVEVAKAKWSAGAK